MSDTSNRDLPPFLSTKKIIYPSRDPKKIPEFVVNTKITFDYSVCILETSKNADGTVVQIPGPVIDDTRKPHPDGYGQPLELVIGRKFKIPAWETCLQTMRIGEVASFDLPPHEVLDFPFVSKQLRDIGEGVDGKSHSHGPTAMCGGMAAAIGLGYEVLNDLMKNPKPLQVTFELLTVTPPGAYEKDRWQFTAEEKLASLGSLKEKGNELLKNSKFSEACDVYGEALARLEDLIVMEKPGEPEYEELARQKVPFYLNISQCKLKQGEFYKAIQAINEIIDLAEGPHLEKALFRRGKANALAWNFEEAKHDFERLANEFPASLKLAKRELSSLAILEQEASRKEQQTALKGAFLAT